MAADQFTGSPLAVVRTVSHVAIEVTDLDKSIAFYQRALGLRIVVDDRSSPTQASIKGLIGNFGFEIAAVAGCCGGVETARPGLCLSFGVEDAKACLRRFQDAGLGEPGALSEMSGATFFTVRDPDGNAIELIEFPHGAIALGQLLVAGETRNPGDAP